MQFYQIESQKYFYIAHTITFLLNAHLNCKTLKEKFAPTDFIFKVQTKSCYEVETSLKVDFYVLTPESSEMQERNYCLIALNRDNDA